MLYDMALESSKVWPGWTESTVRTELRALVYDLQHAALLLASVVKQRETVSLAPEDDRLTYTRSRATSTSSPRSPKASR